MTAKIDKYISVFNLGLQNTFVYRWNYFLRALFGLIPLAGTVFLWSAIFKERGGGLHGYDYGSMIYYYLLAILVSNLVAPTEDEWQIAADIREGQINSLLTKPMSYLAYRFSILYGGLPRHLSRCRRSRDLYLFHFTRADHGSSCLYYLDF
jgi:ABC-2 type transport system permease protein